MDLIALRRLATFRCALELIRAELTRHVRARPQHARVARCERLPSPQNNAAPPMLAELVQRAASIDERTMLLAFRREAFELAVDCAQTSRVERRRACVRCARQLAGELPAAAASDAASANASPERGVAASCVHRDGRLPRVQIECASARDMAGFSFCNTASEILPYEDERASRHDSFDHVERQATCRRSP